MAEAMLSNKAIQGGIDLEVQSCGTAAYHIGYSPDHRTISVLNQNGISFEHRAQQLKSKHFEDYDYLIVMDDSNRENALKIASERFLPKLLLMRSFDSIGKGEAVADPWYGDISDFEHCYETLDRCIDSFLHFLVENHSLKE